MYVSFRPRNPGFSGVLFVAKDRGDTNTMHHRELHENEQKNLRRMTFLEAMIGVLAARDRFEVF